MKFREGVVGPIYCNGQICSLLKRLNMEGNLFVMFMSHEWHCLIASVQMRITVHSYRPSLLKYMLLNVIQLYTPKVKEVVLLRRA